MKTSQNGDPARLRRLLTNDLRVSEETMALLKSDLERLLSAYFEDLTDLTFCVEKEDAAYVLSLSARASFVKEIKVL